MSQESNAFDVLIVDDDFDICEALSEIITQYGYRASTAPNGRAALAALDAARAPPKLILLDFMMPVMNGERFLEEKKKDERWLDIPVLLFTADEQEAQRAVQLGAQGELRKPTPIKTLIAAVSQYCEKTP